MRLPSALLALAAAAPGLPAAAQGLAIVHARAWTGTSETPVEDATILVRDGRIVSVARGAAPPAGMEVLDAGGRPVTAGLFAPATQVGLIEVAGADDTGDEAVSSGKLGAAFDVAPAVNSNSLLVEQARADGVVRTLSFPTGSAVPPFLGQAALLHLGSGSVLDRPRAAMFVRIGGGSASSAGGSRAAQWTLLRRSVEEARALQRGVVRPPEDRLFSRQDLEALAPVATGAMPLAIQTNRQSDIAEAIRFAAELRLRVVIVGGAEAWTLARELAAAKIPVILDPTATLPATYDEIGTRPDNAALLDKAGVTIGIAPAANAIEASYNVGVSSREAAGLAVSNGLSYPAAIRALTAGPASIWGAPDAGTLAPGKAADIIVWDGDPLEPSSAPTAVIVEGRRMSTVTREQRLTERYSPARRSEPWPPAYR